MQEKLQRQNWQRVQYEHQHHHPGRRGEINVARLFRRSRCVVMEAVPLHEKSLSPMQKKSVQDIFKSIRVEESGQKSGHEAQWIKLARIEMNQPENQGGEDRADQKSRDRVDALDPASAGNFSGSGTNLIGHFRLQRLFYL